MDSVEKRSKDNQILCLMLCTFLIFAWFGIFIVADRVADLEDMTERCNLEHNWPWVKGKEKP